MKDPDSQVALGQSAVARRLPQLMVGLVVFGIGIAFMVRGGYGENPWTVLHEGVSLHTPLTIGMATILTGALLVIGLVVAREPIGLGTLANVAVIGVATDITLAVVDEPAGVAGRATLILVSPLIVALGTGLYLGVRLGPGPRDGAMTAVSRRGVAIWKARFVIEAVPFTIGAILGGTVGWGTVYWLIVIGPSVQVAMRLFLQPPLVTRWTDVFGANRTAT